MQRIGDDVAHQLDRFGPLSLLAPLVQAWPDAVGPEIARNAWPARFGRDGTLRVHTSSAAWAFELTHLESRIRASLGEHAPPRLRFVQGPLPSAPADPERASGARPHPTGEHLEQAAGLVARIDDENLRKVVAKAAALSLARAESDRRFW